MKPQYRSPKSVAKNQTIPIDINDPRLKRLNQGKTIARSGAEILPIDFNKNSLLAISAARGGGFGSQSSTSGQVGGQIGADQLPDVRPGTVSNLTFTWSGKDAVITFDFDPNSDENKYATNFRIYAEAGPNVKGYSSTELFPINKSQTSHTITFTEAINIQTFGSYHSNITSFCVSAVDLKGIGIGFNVCIVPSAFATSLNAPQISVSSKTQGYAVQVTNTSELAKSEFSALEVWEIESNDLTAPTIIYGSDGVTPSNYTRIYDSKVVPASIVTTNLNKRWVTARFASNAGVFTGFSSIYSVTPESPVSVDLTPPNEVTINSVAWSVDDIEINYSLPATDEGYQFQIVLTAPNSQTGYFFEHPAIHNTTTPQTLKITKDKIYAQFGQYFSSYTGLFKSIDEAGNRSTGVSFNVPARTNPLSGVTPTFSVNPTANGYIVTWTNVAGMTYADVYERATSWGGGNPTDESDRVYSGQSPVTIQSLNYTTRYIKIRFYDDYGNTSNYSAEQTVVPYDPGTISLIENPVTFATEGSILAGSSPTSNPKVIFNQDGIYAYDTGGTPTTQIINNALTNATTFITRRAEIADWTISPSKIENNLYGGADTYTGLSASGTYAFWAGSPVAGGNSLSKFWVKPDGSVKAQNIEIVGGPSGGNVLSIGGLFTVTSAGAMTATSASISGAITATSGSFTGNLSIGSSGSIYSGTVTPGSPPTLTGQGFILNSDGLQFNSATTQGVTIINGSTGLLTTSSANIGGWNVNASEIKKVAAGGGQIVMSSAAGTYGSIYVASSTGAKTSGLISSNTGSSGEVAFWAGSLAESNLSNINTQGAKDLLGFYVTIDGDLHANNAVIKGTLSGGKTALNDAQRAGYYFDKGTGGFLIGGASPTSPTENTDISTISHIAFTGGTTLSINVTNNGYFRVGEPGKNVILYDAAKNQVRLSPKTTSGTNESGVYLDAYVDDQNYGKNDPQVVRSEGLIPVYGNGTDQPPTSWSIDAGQIGRLVQGRRLYWGYNYTPSTASSSTVAGFSYAEAGDFFFSTASV